MMTGSSSGQTRFAARKFCHFFVDEVVGRSAAPLDDFPSFLVRWDDDAARAHSIRENLGDLFLAFDLQMLAGSSHDYVLGPWFHSHAACLNTSRASRSIHMLPKSTTSSTPVRSATSIASRIVLTNDASVRSDGSIARCTPRFLAWATLGATPCVNRSTTSRHGAPVVPPGVK